MRWAVGIPGHFLALPSLPVIGLLLCLCITPCMFTVPEVRELS